jgi:hypothetical protein
MLVHVLLFFILRCIQDILVTEAALYPITDLIAVIPTCEGREEIIAGSRAWRPGLRTFITTNVTRGPPSSFNGDQQLIKETEVHGETYRTVADEKYVDGARFHGARPGDLRSAISPFLAHTHYSKMSDPYKWMLYGESCLTHAFL